MKTVFHDLNPPMEVDLSHGVSLLIRGVGPDGRGGIVVVVESWNGVLLHSDRLNLTRDQDRKRYAQSLSVKSPEIDQAIVRQKLLEIGGQVRLLLQETETAGEPDTPAVDVAALWEKARDLAEDPHLIIRVGDAVEKLGLVGERKNGVVTYLAATARLFPKPVNVIPKGPSSGGKSFLLERVIMLLPQSAYVNYSTVSPRYLAYCDDDLRHRIVVLYEAAGMEDGMGAYIMRSLLSEGRLDLGTVDKNDGGGIEARRITKEGPTSLFTTTTRAALHPELETRLLSLGITDTPAQSAAIVERMGSEAAGETPEPPELEPFHALQEWLAVAGERRVIIPFGKALAVLTPCRTIRIRRDFRMLLSLISACAILHQAQRQRAGQGEVLASIADYEIVRELMAEAFAATQQDGLTPAQRKTVEVVRTLCEEARDEEAGVSVATVAERLGLDKSAASRRLSGVAHAGYLRNLENRSRQPARYVIGDPMPAPINALPTVEALRAEWGGS